MPSMTRAASGRAGVRLQIVRWLPVKNREPPRRWRYPLGCKVRKNVGDTFAMCPWHFGLLFPRERNELPACKELTPRRGSDILTP